jgi:formate dehydrogenase iron-sulfur subunit
MSAKVFISRDSGALCVSADEVTRALFKAAEKRGLDVEIVRTGSRGMYWLEPTIEISRPEGRIGYGPVKPSDIDSLLDAGMLDRGKHPLSLGLVEDIPFFKKQTRLTFARVGIIDPRSLEDYKAHGGCKGLEKALAAGPDAIVEEVVNSGLRGRGGAGFPTGIKWRTVAQTPPQQKYIVCNADEGDSGTFADRMIMEGDPLVLIEGMTIAGIAVGATYGYVYIRSEYPHAMRPWRSRFGGPARAACWGRMWPARNTPSTWRCGSAPEPMYAARRPRCSKASKASAARFGPSHRCPPMSACSASQPSSTMYCRLPVCRSS